MIKSYGVKFFFIVRANLYWASIIVILPFGNGCKPAFSSWDMEMPTDH